MGRLTLQRTYVFDYTANSIERRQGFIVLVGRRVESMGYARDEEARMQQAAPCRRNPAARRFEDSATERLAQHRCAAGPKRTSPRPNDSPRRISPPPAASRR